MVIKKKQQVAYIGKVFAAVRSTVYIWGSLQGTLVQVGPTWSIDMTSFQLMIKHCSNRLRIPGYTRKCPSIPFKVKWIWSMFSCIGHGQLSLSRSTESIRQFCLLELKYECVPCSLYIVFWPHWAIVQEWYFTKAWAPRDQSLGQ